MSTIHKYAIAIITMTACYAVNAATPGAYVGAGFGESKLGTPNQNIFATQGENSKKIGGIGGRAFAGYNFNQYLGLEAGFTRYAKSKYVGSMNNYSESSLDYSMNAFDLVAKTYLPIGDRRLNVYALGGIAAVNDKVEFTDGGVPFLNEIFSPSTGSKNHRKVRPIYGVGVGYDIPKSQFTASVELTRIQGLGNVKTNPNATPPSEMVAFTLSYNFN